MGICLGHQAIRSVAGVSSAWLKMSCMENKSNITFETPSPIFKDIDNNVPIMRYHSIVVDQMPEDFDVTAITTDDQEIMAIQHKDYLFLIYCITESIGSQMGLRW